jgi:hypothetical protein
MQQQFPGTGRSSIKLNGLLGQFKSPNSNYKIVFFSTVANSKDEAYSSFLEKLVPLREKVAAFKIKEFETLLQRDINDSRIAEDIIPYLINIKNDPNHIAFFPSVLCVLMPKGFLKGYSNYVSNNSNETVCYPKPDRPTTSLDDVRYGNSWKLSNFPNNEGVLSRFSQIEIFINNADFLVLDGQHRTNAYRAVAGLFPEHGSIYKSFYESLGDTIPISSLEADLPVTLIWFESENDYEIKPSYISRNLFIDVNNTSKVISNSRLILLNDKQPSNVMTRLFYSYLGSEYGFNLSKLSLFHYAFDYSGNLSDRSTPICPLCLFAPEIINHSLDWFFFSKPGNFYLGKSSVKAGENTDFGYFDKYFNSSSLENFIKTTDQFDVPVKLVKPGTDLESLKTEAYNSDIFPVIYDLISNFPFVEKFIISTELIHRDYAERKNCFHQNSARVTAFEKAILGGESLYYTLFASSKNNNYKVAITEQGGIEESFANILKSQFDLQHSNSIDLVYNRIRTYIFSTGYLMAFSFFHTESGLSLDDAKSEFISRIKSVDEHEWVIFFTDLWSSYFGDRESKPSLWPLVTNLILRVIQKEGEFFDNDAHRDWSPEVQIVKMNMRRLLLSFIDQKHGGRRPNSLKRSEFPAAEINTLANTAIEQMQVVFSNSGLLPDSSLDPFTDKTKDAFEELIKTA